MEPAPFSSQLLAAAWPAYWPPWTSPHFFTMLVGLNCIPRSVPWLHFCLLSEELAGALQNACWFSVGLRPVLVPPDLIAQLLGGEWYVSTWESGNQCLCRYYRRFAQEPFPSCILLVNHPRDSLLTLRSRNSGMIHLTVLVFLLPCQLLRKCWCYVQLHLSCAEGFLFFLLPITRYPVLPVSTQGLNSGAVEWKVAHRS